MAHSCCMCVLRTDFFSSVNLFQVSLQYYSHLNALQFLRYTHMVEPLLSLIYAHRSYFHMGNEGMKQPELTDFATRTQEQIQRCGPSIVAD